MMEILFTGAARKDLAEAAAWFEDHAALGGAAFVKLVRMTVERIREVPLATPPWRPGSRFRTRTVPRVGYQIFYEIADGAIRIVGLAHVRDVLTTHQVPTIH